MDMGLGRDHLNDVEPEITGYEEQVKWKDCLLNGVWVTKDGRKISVKDMTFKHLENTIYLLMKQERALSLGFDVEGKTEQKIAVVNMWLTMIRDEWRQRIIENGGMGDEL